MTGKLLPKDVDGRVLEVLRRKGGRVARGVLANALGKGYAARDVWYAVRQLEKRGAVVVSKGTKQSYSGARVFYVEVVR